MAVTTISIKLISNMGGGDTKVLSLKIGTQISDLFDLGHINGSPENYHFRVNSASMQPAYMLNDGDVLSVVPKKTEGAV